MTQTAKHTPAPWVWEKFAHGYALVSQTEMEYGSTRKAVDLSYEGPNRDLIAAAPKLLEALKTVWLEATHCNNETGLVNPFMVKVEAAIAEAEGGK